MSLARGTRPCGFVAHQRSPTSFKRHEAADLREENALALPAATRQVQIWMKRKYSIEKESDDEPPFPVSHCHRRRRRRLLLLLLLNQHGEESSVTAAILETSFNWFMSSSPPPLNRAALGPNFPSRFSSRRRSMYKPFVLHPFIQRLREHPGFASADRELIAEAEAHPAYCLASRACVQRWEAMQRCRQASRAPAQQWNVYGSGIGLRQRRALLCRGAVCAVLVRRLMRFQGQHVCRNVLHHACCVISRRHFLVSKNAAETLFQEGQRLYGEQRYREAAESWGQAALLQHAPSHAFLSSLLFEGRADVAQDVQRAFEFASWWGGVGLRAQQGRSRPLPRSRRWCC
jgi:hypothetical protein